VVKVWLDELSIEMNTRERETDKERDKDRKDKEGKDVDQVWCKREN